MFAHLLLHEVSDVLHHVHSLPSVVGISEVEAGALDDVVGPDEHALVWTAGHVTEILLEVVVAGGAGRLDQSLRGHKVDLQVHELFVAAAEVLLAPRVEVGTGLSEDLQLLLAGSLGRTVVSTVEEMDLVASHPVLIVRVPATAIVEHTVSGLLT